MAIFDEKPEIQEDLASEFRLRAENSQYGLGGSMCGLAAYRAAEAAEAAARAAATLDGLRAAIAREPWNIFVVSRHEGAIDWLCGMLGLRRGGRSEYPATMADADREWLINPAGDLIRLERGNLEPRDAHGIAIGNLPMGIAAQCDRVYAIEFAGQPPRGHEYTADDMAAAGARIARYRVVAD